MRPGPHGAAHGSDGEPARDTARDTALRLALVLAALLTAAAAWSRYDDPALALMLGAVRFCG